MQEEELKSAAEKLRSGLISLGFSETKGGSLVKSGAASCVAQFFYNSGGNFAGICEELKERTEGFGAEAFSRYVVYEFVFVSCGDVYEDASDRVIMLRDLYNYLKKQGMVCDVIYYNAETGAYNNAGGGRVKSGELRTVLKNPSGVAANVPSAERTGGTFVPAYIIIGINAAIFITELLLRLRGQSDFIQEWGIQDNGKILSGEVHRLVTAMFLHADFAHISGNMLSLLYLARPMCRTHSPREFLTIYGISGLFGNILSFFFVDALSLGASGAVLGLGGGLIYKMFISPEKAYFKSTGNYISLALMVVYNLIYGLVMTGSGINNFAHFGGFAAGFAVTMLLEKMKRRNAG